MFGSAVMEALIALAFLYLLLSVVCSTLNEFISRVMKARHRTLVKGLEHLLVDPQLRQELLDHPLVKVLGKEPTYIPSKTFAMALVDLIAPAGEGVASGPEVTSADASGAPKSASESTQEITAENAADDAKTNATASGTSTEALGPPLGYEQVRQAIGNLPDTDLRRSLLVLVDNADQRIDAIQGAVADWFDGTMDRASEWYKTRSHWVLLVLALLVSVGLNADTLEVANSLWRDSGLRDGIVAAADSYVAAFDGQGTTPQEQAEANPAQALGQVTQALSSFKLTLGWTTFPSTVGGWFFKVVGLLLTTLAVSLGAPFWFDVVNKVILMRGQSSSSTSSSKSNNGS